MHIIDDEKDDALFSYITWKWWRVQQIETGSDVWWVGAVCGDDEQRPIRDRLEWQLLHLSCVK